MNDFNLTLKKLIEDTEPISVASLFALSALDRSDLAKIDRAWPTIPIERRQAAMQHLVDIAEENFEVDFGSIYRIGLNDPDETVHAAAINGLWEDTDPALITKLMSDLQSDRSELVRAAAAAALGQFVLAGEYEELSADKVRPVISALETTFTDSNEALEVRRRALEALAYHTSDRLPQYIRMAYNGTEQPMRVSAVQAMGRSADEQWSEIVLDELNSIDAEMRFEAAQACGMLEVTRAVKPLTKLVDDVDDQVQRMSIWALGEIGGEAARQVLLHVLDSRDEDFLLEAADEALAELEFKSGNLDFKMLDINDPDTEDEDDDEDWILDLMDEDEDDDDEEEYEAGSDEEDDDLAQEE